MKDMDFQGKNITIFGLGRYEHGSGLAAVKFFIRQGANLIISDLQTEEELAEQVERVRSYAQEQDFKGTMTWHMGGHQKEDVLNADMLVANQAIPVTSEWIRLADENDIPVETEMTLFFDRCPAKIIGITGTRGKSTTTALIAHLLKSYDRKVWLGGNIAKGSPLDMLDEMKKGDLVVLELSNFMLEYLGRKEQSPQIAVLLNVLPDHLNRYQGGMDEYASVKGLITKFQTENDLLIANRSNDHARSLAENSPAKVVWFSKELELKDGYFLEGGMAAESKDGNKTELVDIRQVSLRGEHNRDNILAAVACVRQLEADLKPMQEAIGSFASLEGRLQFIDEVKGVTFINDTTSTTPVAAVAAIRSLEARPLILIAGGFDKDLPLEDFAAEVSKVKTLIWLPGSGSDRMRPLVTAEVDQVEVQNMSEAVKHAFSRAEKGDVILLSPGFASFGLFKNEFHRGEKFLLAIEDLKRTLQNHV